MANECLATCNTQKTQTIVERLTEMEVETGAQLEKIKKAKAFLDANPGFQDLKELMGRY